MQNAEYFISLFSPLMSWGGPKAFYIPLAVIIKPFQLLISEQFWDMSRSLLRYLLCSVCQCSLPYYVLSHPLFLCVFLPSHLLLPPVCLSKHNSPKVSMSFCFNVVLEKQQNIEMQTRWHVESDSYSPSENVTMGVWYLVTHTNGFTGRSQVFHK